MSFALVAKRQKSEVFVHSLEPCLALRGAIFASFTAFQGPVLCSRLYHLIWLVSLLASVCWSCYLSVFSCITPKEKLISTAKLLKSCRGAISENYLQIYIAPEMILLCQETLTSTSALFIAGICLSALCLFSCIVWNWKIMRVFFIPKRTEPLKRVNSLRGFFAKGLLWVI